MLIIIVFFSKYVVLRKSRDDASPDVLCGIAGYIDFPQFRMETDDYVRNATDRLFKVGDIYVLFHLKRLDVQFGLMWNFVVSRSDTS